MYNREQCFEIISNASSDIKKKFGVESLCVFGSVARGDNKPESDVDICVEMPPKAMKVIALKNYLHDLLGVSIDLIRRNKNMDEFLTNEINRDGIYLI